jgi:hypothetical protein
MVGSSGDGSARYRVARAAAGLPIVTGGLAYLSVLYMAQVAQFVLGVTTATPLLPTMLGMGSVCVASAAAIRAVESIDELAGYRPRRLGAVYGRADHDAAAALTGVVIYAGLGAARFWSLSPSSLAAKGAFAHRAGLIPAGLEYATTAQRLMLQRFGKRFGCHTCGTRLAKLYVGDHVPPLSLANSRSRLARIVHGPVKFCFHPQCRTCCAKQATALARQSNGISGRSAAGAAVVHLPSLLRRTSYVGAAVVGLALAAEARWPAALYVARATERAVDQLARCGKPVRAELARGVARLKKQLG